MKITWRTVAETEGRDPYEDEQDQYRFVIRNTLLADLWWYDPSSDSFSDSDEPYWTLSVTKYEPFGDMNGEMITEQFTTEGGALPLPEAWARETIEEFIGSIGRIHLRMQELNASDDPPPFTYFQTKRGPMFCWTTEKDTSSADADDKGWFYSFVYKPTGSGARTAKATSWVMVERSLQRHRKRKDAKARCERLYDKWEKTGRLPV